MIDVIGRLLITILSLSIVVIIHEWGHFLVARRLGVRVEKFTVGFGPEIFGWTRGVTRYALCIFPLGGMVKMAGESPEEATQKPDEFFAQPWYGRATIALAGPVMNYLLAFVLFTFVALKWGTVKPSDQPVIGDMVVGLPAAQAKLEIGDRVRKIDGTIVTTWEQMADIIHQRPDQTLTVEVERTSAEGQPTQTLKVKLTPQRDPQRGVGLIGVMPHVEKVKLGLVASVKASLRDIQAWTMQPIHYISHKVRHWEGPKELSGPFGILLMGVKVAKQGMGDMLSLMAIISTGLGLFNLFPIPMLDGGHVFMYMIEGAIRRPLSRRFLQTANMMGLLFVVTIFLYASYQDVLRSLQDIIRIYHHALHWIHLEK